MKNRIPKTWQAVSVGIAVIAILLSGQTCGQKEPAYQRWGITKPTTDRAAEKELAFAYDLFYDLKFEDAKRVYQQVADNFPKSAEAHVGLSMAYRYTGERNKALAECKKALDLDPDAVAAQLNYADLCPPFRGIEPDLNLTDSQRIVTSIDYCQKALKSQHPLSTYAHIILFGDYLLGLGGLPKARQQLIELGKKGYSPLMLKDFAYNLLNTVDPDAILFTQGDNDTYPLLSLQEHEGVRKDVSVVNINLLNIPLVAGLMRDSMKVPISYNDSVLETIQARYDSAAKKIILPQEVLIKNIIENARKQNRPVYFSTTVARENIGTYQDYLVLEGLAWKVINVKTRDSTDIDKVITNMNEKYRLDNIEQKEIWLSNLSPITRNVKGLGINYVACYSVMADYYQKQKENDKAVSCYRNMAKIAPPIGREDMMQMILDKWLELKPDDNEAKELEKKYLGGS